jgi:hypothetical protein
LDVINRRVKSNVIQDETSFKLIIWNMGSGMKKSMEQRHPGENREKVRPGTGQETGLGHLITLP